MIFGKEFELNCRLRILTTPIASLEINTNVIKFFTLIFCKLLFLYRLWDKIICLGVLYEYYIRTKK